MPPEEDVPLWDKYGPKPAESAWDDVDGGEPDPREVRRARAEEIQYYRDMGTFKKVKIQECREKIGKEPIGVRWIDHNKGDKHNPNVRSSLVATEFNTGVGNDLYAGTPPLEAPRAIVSITAAGRGRKAIIT